MSDSMSFEDLCVVFNYTPKGRLLSNAETAELLHLKPSALDYKRFNGYGPRFIRNEGARKVLYSERDVLFFLWEGLRTTTSDEPRKSRSSRVYKTSANA